MKSGDYQDIRRRMEGAISAFKHDLAALRTGRASANLLDPVQVKAYGTEMPLNQVATVSVPEPRMISVSVWDKSMVGTIEKAVRNSDLGFNPSTDGKVVRIPIPQLTEERRKDLVKHAHHVAEEARTAIRQVRRDGNDKLKKMLKSHEISEDDEKRALDEIQKMTDKHIDEVADVLKSKEHDIMAV